MSTREALLPPYLARNPAWVALAQSIDAVWANEVDAPIAFLRKLRYLYIPSEDGANTIAAGQLMDFALDFDKPEKEILIRTANMLGLPFSNSDLLTDADYLRVVRNLSQFWYEKGLFSFIDFIGFCINADLSIAQMWSDQPASTSYGTMLPEGDPGIGSPIWDGGDWWPTTHVRVSFDPVKFTGIDVQGLTRFFYDFANYNLVLESIQDTVTTYVVAEPGDLESRIVAMGNIVRVVMYIPTKP